MTDLERCYVAAQRILSYRFNGEVELRRKLGAKRFDRETVDATIARLRDEHWLDDARFAGSFVRTRSSRNVGARRIVRELQAAGVDREVAAKAIAENTDADRERSQLAELCAKRARMLVRRHGEDYLDTDEGRNKLVSWLLKQGYDAALVYEALKEIRLAHHQPDS